LVSRLALRCGCVAAMRAKRKIGRRQIVEVRGDR
jgi:hypothetical protein